MVVAPPRFPSPCWWHGGRHSRRKGPSLEEPFRVELSGANNEGEFGGLLSEAGRISLGRQALCDLLVETRRDLLELVVRSGSPGACQTPDSDVAQ